MVWNFILSGSEQEDEGLKVIIMSLRNNACDESFGIQNSLSHARKYHRYKFQVLQKFCRRKYRHSLTNALKSSKTHKRGSIVAETQSAESIGLNTNNVTTVILFNI